MESRSQSYGALHSTSSRGKNSTFKTCGCIGNKGVRAGQELDAAADCTVYDLGVIAS